MFRCERSVKPSHARSRRPAAAWIDWTTADTGGARISYPAPARQLPNGIAIVDTAISRREDVDL
jgi:hypothetical protein